MNILEWNEMIEAEFSLSVKMNLLNRIFDADGGEIAFPIGDRPAIRGFFIHARYEKFNFDQIIFSLFLSFVTDELNQSAQCHFDARNSYFVSHSQLCFLIGQFHSS